MNATYPAYSPTLTSDRPSSSFALRPASAWNPSPTCDPRRFAATKQLTRKGKAAQSRKIVVDTSRTRDTSSWDSYELNVTETNTSDASITMPSSSSSAPPSSTFASVRDNEEIDNKFTAPSAFYSPPSYSAGIAFTSCSDSAVVRERRTSMAENAWRELDDFLGSSSDRSSSSGSSHSSSGAGDAGNTGSRPHSNDGAGEDEPTRTSHANAVYVKILVSALDEKPEALPCELERTVRGHLTALGFPTHLCNAQFLSVGLVGS